MRTRWARSVSRHAAAVEAWEAGGKQGKKPRLGQQKEPSALYRGITHPMLPLSVAGVLWYQGEGNASQADLYPDLFERLVASWREGFRDPELPVNFVQLPNFSTRADWAAFRRTQRASAAADPLVGMAVTIDVGDPKDIHPKNKRPVGERLARLALANSYGRDDVVAGSPRPTSVRLDPENPRRVLVTLDRVGEGLGARPAGEPVRGVNLVDTRTNTSGPAEVEIVSADTIALTAADVPTPNQVRHANVNNPPVHLFSGEGLPVEPFVAAIEGVPQEVPPAAAGDEVRFPGFRTARGSELNRRASGTLTRRGLTVTLGTASGEFRVTKGGTGIAGAGEAGEPGRPDFQLNDGESFTLSFDAPGTLEAVVFGHFPGGSAVTFANGDDEVEVRTEVTGRFDPAAETAVGLAFGAGDVIDVRPVADATARTPGQTLRLADLVVEVGEGG